MVPSPKVATYDLQPEMSAPELTAKAVEAIRSGKYDLIVLNYANPDMVGHTGSLPAAIKAVETVDAGLGQIADAVERAGGALLVTADHGNCEMMRDPATGGPHTSHTTNPVPLLLTGARNRVAGGGRVPRRHRADLARTDGSAEAQGDDGRVAAGGVRRPPTLSRSVARAGGQEQARARAASPSLLSPATGAKRISEPGRCLLNAPQPQHIRHRIKPGLLRARPQRCAQRAAREDHAVLGLVRRARCAPPVRRTPPCDRRPRCRRAARQSRCRPDCARRCGRRGRAASAGRDRRRGRRPPPGRASARCRTARRSSCCGAFRAPRCRNPRPASWPRA